MDYARSSQAECVFDWPWPAESGEKWGLESTSLVGFGTVSLLVAFDNDNVAGKAATFHAQ
jgi:hypothetical protein